MITKLLIFALLAVQIFSYEIIIDRTTQTPKPNGRDNTKEIVFDGVTGLIWQDDKKVEYREGNWYAAKQYCKTLNFADYDDWSLPTINELKTLPASPILKYSMTNMYYFYWSSSSYSFSEYAWRFDLKSKNASYYDKKHGNYAVRCVRREKDNTLSFEKLLTKLMKKELQSIKKPQTDLSLVKDQFETTAEFTQRIKRTKEEQKKIIVKYQRTYELKKQKAKKRAIKKALSKVWGLAILKDLQYDADNGYFIADLSFERKKDFSKKVAIKVPRKNARDFNALFNTLKSQAVFDYDGSNIILKDIRILYKDKTYLVQFTDMNINDTKIAVNIHNDMNVDSVAGITNIKVSGNSLRTFDTSKLNNFNELEQLLNKAQAVKEDKRKWLFVVGIEQYEFTDNISYAKRSAEMFVKIAQKRLGVSKANSYVMIDAQASQAHIKTSMKKLLRRVKKGDSIYFYYNGHGVPVPSLKNEPFMLTADTEPDFVGDEAFFSLKNIYAKLSESKAGKIIAVVDSCFSGVTDGKSVLKGVAATKMVAKSVSFNKEKMVVISAGKSNQYSNGYNKKGYRLFSFYVMKNIIKGYTTIKELYKSTKTQTYETSIEEYGDARTQEPTIEGNFRMSL